MKMLINWARRLQSQLRQVLKMALDEEKLVVGTRIQPVGIIIDGER
jgi:hypothetical protein